MRGGFKAVLAKWIKTTFKRGGNKVVPMFKSQEFIGW
jgi:hypothetical protein